MWRELVEQYVALPEPVKAIGIIAIVIAGHWLHDAFLKDSASKFRDKLKNRRK